MLGALTRLERISSSHFLLESIQLLFLMGPTSFLMGSALEYTRVSEAMSAPWILYVLYFLRLVGWLVG